MTGALDDPRTWALALIALAVVAAVIRLLLWHRAAPAEARPPSWRFAVLLALQPVVGILLWLVLFPPSVAGRAGTLIVATAGVPTTINQAAGDVLVALPEAGAVPGATRVPDLATALRRHPGVARVRVEGQGLPPRDHHAVGVPLDFAPPGSRPAERTSTPKGCAPTRT